MCNDDAVSDDGVNVSGFVLTDAMHVAAGCVDAFIVIRVEILCRAAAHVDGCY